MLTVFLGALILGFLFNATPGPIFAESLRRGLKGGFSPALAVQFGSLVGDAIWAVLGLVGVSTLLSVSWLVEPLAIAGALYLLYLGVQGIRDALKLAREARRHRGPVPINEEVAPVDHRAGALAAGILMSTTNPQNIAFWAALGSVMPSLGQVTPGPEHYAMFFVGIMLSSLLWAFICAALIAWMRHQLPLGVQASLAFICGAALIALAILQLYRTWESRHSGRANAETKPAAAAGAA